MSTPPNSSSSHSMAPAPLTSLTEEAFLKLFASINATSYDFTKVITSLSFSSTALKDLLTPIQIQRLLERSIKEKNPFIFKEVISLCKNIENINYASLWSIMLTGGLTNPEVRAFLPFFNLCFNNFSSIDNRKLIEEISSSLPSLQRNNFDLFKDIFKYLTPKLELDYKSLSDLFAYNKKTILFFKEKNIPLSDRYMVGAILYSYTLATLKSAKDIEFLDYTQALKRQTNKEKIDSLTVIIKSINVEEDSVIYRHKFAIFLEYFGADFFPVAPISRPHNAHPKIKISQEQELTQNNLFAMLFSLPYGYLPINFIDFVSSHYPAPTSLNLKCIQTLFQSTAAVFYVAEIKEILVKNWGIKEFSRIIKTSGFISSLTREFVTPPDLIRELYNMSPPPYDYTGVEISQHVLTNFINGYSHPTHLISCLQDILNKPQTPILEMALSKSLSNFFEINNLINYNKRYPASKDFEVFAIQAAPHFKSLEETYKKLSMMPVSAFTNSPFLEKVFVILKSSLEKQKLSTILPINTNADDSLNKTNKI